MDILDHNTSRNDVDYDQRLRALEEIIQRQGRELQAVAYRQDNNDDSGTWLKIRLGLIVATWQHDLRDDLSRIIGQLERISSPETEWEILRRQVASIEPEFAAHIEQEYPNMTLLERKISLLVGLGMPEGEIARMLKKPDDMIAFHTKQIRSKMDKSALALRNGKN